MDGERRVTGRDLIEALSSLDDDMLDLEIITEGCDCMGEVACLWLQEYRSAGEDVRQVVIGRDAQWMRGDSTVLVPALPIHDDPPTIRDNPEAP